MDLSEVRSLNEPAADPARSYLEINEYAPLHPGTRSWEVERQNVTIEKVIGKGAFGQVAQGKASNLCGREETYIYKCGGRVYLGIKCLMLW